jgi:hypothetical protein
MVSQSMKSSAPPVSPAGSDSTSPVPQTTPVDDKKPHFNIWWILGTAAALRLLIALLFVTFTIPLELGQPWFLQHGGDQRLMFALGHSLIHGPTIQSVVGIGQALVMAPLIALTGATAYPEIVLPLTIVNGLILGPLSVLIVGGMALTLTRQKALTATAALFWAVLPLLAYGAFFWHPESAVVQSAMVPKIGWLTGLSDPPAAFFLLVAILLLAGLISAEQPPFSWMLAAGMALGLAMDFRAHTAFLIVFLAGYVWWTEGWRSFLVLAGGGLLTYLPQAWYNQLIFGLPLTIGYITYGDVANFGGTFRRPWNDVVSNLWFSPRYFVETIAYFVGNRAWLVLPLAIGGGLLVLALRFVQHHYGWKTTALLVISPLAYLLPLLATYNFRDDPVRMLMPVIPMLLIIALIGVSEIAQSFKPNQTPAEPHPAAD